MTEVTVTYEGFIAAIPAFADTSVYPEVIVTTYLDHAKCFVSTKNGKRLRNKCREYALYLLTAHYLVLKDALADSMAGGQVGFNTHARIAEVDVSMEAPESESAFQEWLGLTGYGRELRALLANRGAAPALISTATPYRVFQ